MRPLNGQIPLGQTGLISGRLGVSGGYGAPAEAFEAAFERGCNFFYHGSLRRQGMTSAIKNLSAKGFREKLIVMDQIYTSFIPQFRFSFNRFLKLTGCEYADVLLLGWYNGLPPKRVMDLCHELKEKKLVRYIAVSGHNRKAFPVFAGSGKFDLLQLRYNAAHRGADTEVFPLLPEKRPGILSYTATRWGQLLNPKKMPPGEKTPRASDCYRFALSSPYIDVCMTGPKNMDEMQEALTTLDRGPMPEAEMQWMRKVGDYMRGGKK